MMHDLLEAMLRGYKLAHTQEMRLAAIWLEKKIVCAHGPEFRLADGIKIRVENDQIADCGPDKPATHEIIGCFGTLSSSVLNLLCLPIGDTTPTIIKVK